MGTTKRTYEETHPWITFTLDFMKPHPRLWTLLGECQSMCEQIAGIPIRPDRAQKLYHLYLAKGVQATTAIEGNTLTEQEVLAHIEGKLELPPSKKYLGLEIDNIIEECNRITGLIEPGFPFTIKASVLQVSTIKEINKRVLKGLDLNKDVKPGEIRKHEVGVGLYKGAPAEDCEYLLGRLCKWLDMVTGGFKAPEGMQIVYSILKAIAAHLYLAWIHPFGDGNGRTARLVEFQILISSGVPAPAAHLLSNHYNETRSEYYRQLDETSLSGGDVIPFFFYTALGFRDGLQNQLNYIQKEQQDILWENYIYELFKDKTGKADIRRRHLAIDISRFEKEKIPIKDLINITPRTAVAYSKLTRKALSRDINILINMGLISKHGKKVKAYNETIKAFLPTKARLKNR